MTFGPGAILFSKLYRNIELAKQAAIAAATYSAKQGQTPQIIAKALGYSDGGQALAKANNMRVDQVLDMGTVLVIPKIDPVTDASQVKFNSAVAASKNGAPPSILADVEAGKSIDQMVADRGLSRPEIIRQMEAAGLGLETVDPTSDNGDVRTIRIVDRESGKVIASHYEDFQHGDTSATITNAEGKEVAVPISKAPINSSQKPFTPQGDPEQEVDGRVDHRIQKTENLDGIARVYNQARSDILEFNPIPDANRINEGGSLLVLSKERRTSLETINSLQADVDKAVSPAEKDDKTRALKLAVNTDLLSAAKNGGYAPETLKLYLDQRQGDLEALGPKTGAYKTIVSDERKAVEDGFNAVFKPLSSSITAAQQDPSRWGDVQTEITRQFETLAKDAPDGGEAAINNARETLKLYGPADIKFTDALDASGYEVLVGKPARSVQEAYSKGENKFNGLNGHAGKEAQREDGASRAAKTLNEVTKNLTPETAILILKEANKETNALGDPKTKVIDLIEQTIGKRTAIASGASPDHLLGGKNSNIADEIKFSLQLTQRDTVANYSSVMGHIVKAPQGKTIIDERALSIAKSIKSTQDQTFTDWENKLPEKTRGFTLDDKKKIGKEMGIPYPEIKAAMPDQIGEPFRKAVANGEDPSLTLAVIKQLKNSGDVANAAIVLDAAIKGADDLVANSRNIVGEFSKDHLVVADDWKSSLSTKQLTDGINESIAKNPGSKDKMDAQGTLIFRSLAALHGVESDLQGLPGFDRYQASIHTLEHDDQTQFAVNNSEGAWKEMGEAYIESTTPADKVPVPNTPSLFWSGRAVIGMHKTLAAYEALGGNKAYKPPTPGSIDLASRLNPAQVDGKLAQSSSVLLNGPNATTDPAARKAALESLSKSFDGSKFDPRAGITTASGFGKGLAAIQGLLYLGSTAENAANPDLLSKSFAVWLTGGIAYEAGQFGAGLARSVVENGRFPKGGFLDRASSFAEVSGTPKWNWFSKYFDRAGGVLMVAYTLDHVAKGKWANSAFAATTTLGTFLSMMKSPKAGLWGAGLAVVGIVGEMVYNNIRKSQAASYYEGPTEQFLIKANFRPEAAKILADHDDEGNSVGSIIEPLAKQLKMTPEALTEMLRTSTDDARLKEFVRNVHEVKPDKNSRQYPMSAPERLPPLKMPDGGTVSRDPSEGRARTIPELADWVGQNLILTN
ncbi:LysM peptidoglycan-binding domain-containing protein (plasmid) [Phyllobacterium sp. 628]|uniref:LysM peptidoglycan-binding domain-containing protein n=1 Tax=Phyllobacterium sp. 628 TaxID=2718938 RepID=UPI001662586A|nr:LysM domain-containing protein [Phyllobacterium sp. 628]QND54433.1 LysM peptidoglycan-binding domain-containing protein [Phyllobacterium sp. 628]